MDFEKEYSERFDELRKNRVKTSFYKYGSGGVHGGGVACDCDVGQPRLGIDHQLGSGIFGNRNSVISQGKK